MTRDGMAITDKIAAGVGKGLAGSLELQANVRLELFGPDGKLKDVRESHNQVQTAGLAFVADQLSAAPGGAAIGWMAVGTGTGQAVGDTTLDTELDRNALDSSTDAGAVLTMVCTWAAADGTGAITEAGVFNAAVAGTMVVYDDFDVINKAAGDSLVVTWTITIS